ARPMVGREWLPPDDIYLVRSLDDRFAPLTSNDSAWGVAGVTIDATGFDAVGTRSIPLRALLPDQQARGLELRWSPGGAPGAWRLEGLPAPASGAVTGLHLALANGALESESAAVLDLQVELTTADGITVSLPLSRWGALPPPLTVRLAKDDFLAGLSGMDLAQGAPVERVLQGYDIPFADFAALDSRFDPGRVVAAGLVVNRSEAGSLWLADVGQLVER
ncbi:MAG TPA: hypothetical protein VFP56_04055, partial [Candidatus Limnocylindrales bacterium]|nr:hypothetical protein [Candidatus Limnocylindrales bacterium]